MRTARTGGVPLRVVLGLIAGCGAPPAPAEPVDAGSGAAAAGEALPEGPVVATVDGTPIALADVEDVARRTGLSPPEALRRLEDEVLLYRAAERAGVTTDAEDERTVRRAMVQAYLAAEIEARITPESIDEALVRTRRERDANLFAQPERRASTHVLCRRRPARATAAGAGDDEGEVDPEDAAAATDAAIARFAARVAEELRAEADPAAAAARYRDENAEGRAFEIVVEDVPPARRTGDVDESFAAALFALAEPGDVTAPVTTSFGVHVVVLTDIVPAWSVPDDEVYALVRRQLAVEARAEALVALEDRLLAEHPPVIDPDVATRLLTTDLGALAP